MSSKRRGLGGLASDINQEPAGDAPARKSAGATRAARGLVGADDYLKNRDFRTILEVETERVRISPQHDRLIEYLTEENTQELIESIRTKGQIEPAIARPLEKGDDADFEIVAGARRWWVCKHLKIKLRIEVKEMDDTSAFEINWASNQRSDISAYEAARYIVHGLKEHYEGNQRSMERAIGISHQKIGRYLRLHSVLDFLEDAVEDPRQITLDHAERLSKYLKDRKTKEAVIKTARNLSKREELLSARKVVSQLLTVGKSSKNPTRKKAENWVNNKGLHVASVNVTANEATIRIPRELAEAHRKVVDEFLSNLGLRKGEEPSE